MLRIAKGYRFTVFEIVLGLLFIIAFIMPMVRLMMMSFKTETGYSFSNYQLLLNDVRTITAIKNTIIIGGASNLISLFLGGIFAFSVAYTNLKWKKLLELLVLMPFIIPSYIITLSWSNLLAPNGWINSCLALVGIKPLTIYSLTGIIVVLGICNVPIVYLITVNLLRKIPRDLEWAARASGYNQWQTLYKINLPQVMPALVGGSVLAFLAAIDNFAVPAFLGISSGVSVLSTYIYEKAISFGPSAFNYAAALAVVLSIIALTGAALPSLLVRKKLTLDSIKDDDSIRIEFAPGIRRITEVVFLIFLIMINIVPLITMTLSSLQKAYGVKLALNTISFKNYLFIFKNERILASIFNSLALAAIATLICIIIGTIIAYLKVRSHSQTMKLGETSATLTYAIPGIVLALAMIFHWVEPFPSIRPRIYGTVKILIIAYVTRYLILQVKGSVAAIMAVDPSVEEAARVSGSSRLRTWVKIIIPLLAKQILASAFLIYISAMTELTLSSMLAAAGTKTIGLTIFNLQQAGNYNISSALSSIIVLLILAIYFLPKLFGIKNIH